MFSTEHTFSRLHVCIYNNVAKALQDQVNETGLVVICVATLHGKIMSEVSDNFLTENQSFAKAPLASSKVEILQLGQCKKINEPIQMVNVVQILDGVNLTN